MSTDNNTSTAKQFTVEKFGRMAEHEMVEVPNGTECPDFRDVYYFLDNEEVYNAGYRSGGTWVEGWWA